MNYMSDGNGASGGNVTYPYSPETKDVHKTLIESIHGYFYEVRYQDGVPVERYHSPQCEGITGYRAKDYLSDPYLWIKMIYEKDQDRVLNFFNNLKCCGLQNSIEHRIVRRDGQVIWVLNQCVVVCDKDGKPSRLDGLILDVTYRREAEDLLKKAKDEAEEANRMKDRFLSLVTHDLKSPISSIKGYIEMMKTMDPGPEMMKIFLNEAFDSCDYMMKMIQELLLMNRINSGGIVPHLRFHDLNCLAEQSLRNFRFHADNKGISLTNDIPGGERIYVDDRLYIEVLSNLISNAIKFCKKGDRVRLSTKEKRPLIVIVSDTGTGMSKETLSRLFSAEARSTPGTAGEIGTGLGLMLTHDIIQAHEGKISAESRPGEGSRFYITVPEKTPVILIVDDEPLFLESMKECVSQIGAEVVLCADPSEAVRIAEERRPHLILLDVFMPEIDGLEVLSRMKINPFTKEIPIIIITGSSDKETYQSALQKGAADFIAKPVREEELIPRIRKFIG